MPIYKQLGFGRSNSLLKRRCCNASGPNLLSCADITNQEPQTEKRCFFLTCVQHHNTAKTPVLHSFGFLGRAKASRWSWYYTAGSQQTLWQHSWCCSGRELTEEHASQTKISSVITETTSTSSHLLLHHKAFVWLSGIRSAWYWFIMSLFCLFYLSPWIWFKVFRTCSQFGAAGLVPGHPGRARFTNAKGWKQLVFPATFKQILLCKMPLRVAGILDKLRQMAFPFLILLYMKNR